MDPHRKLTDAEADEALRALFADHGTVNATAGLDARIMARITAGHVTPAPVRGLIPRGAWIGIGVGALVLTSVLFLIPDASSASTGPLFAMPSGLLDLLASKWLLMAVASGGLLLLFHSYLTRTRAAQLV